MAWLVRLAVATVAVFAVSSAMLAEGEDLSAKTGTPPAATATTQPVAQAPASRPDLAAAKALIAEYKQLSDHLGQISDPAEAIALLEKFSEANKGTPQAKSAQDQLALWKDRASKGLVRFGVGENWKLKADADKINAKVDELLTRAGGEEPTAALKTLTQAAALHPYRADILFKRFEVLLKAGREAEAGGALGKIHTLDKNNAFVVNDMGVIQGRQQLWGAAFDLLLQAAVEAPDTDAIWDNFDLVAVMATEAGASKDVLTKADADLRTAIVRIHKLGKHGGETRWGNTWISENDYKSNLRKIQEAIGSSANAANLVTQKTAEVANLQTQKDLFNKAHSGETGADKKLKEFDDNIKLATDALAAAKKKAEAKVSTSRDPGHADKLVLLNLDGTPGEKLDGKPFGAVAAEAPPAKASDKKK